jgi:FkbM family methyltransferase
MVRALVQRFTLALLRRLPQRSLRAAWRRAYSSPRLRPVLAALNRSLGSRQATIAAGPLRGLRMQPGSSNASYLLGASEPGVQDVFVRHVRRGAVVFDVGANVGYFSLLSAKLAGERGAVFAFEPMPQNLVTLRTNASLNPGLAPIEIIPAAVGAHGGHAHMASSFGGLTASFVDTGTPGATIVPVISLDEEVAGGRLPPPDFVKIDVEGAEALVLAGMARVLESVRPVVLIELHGDGTSPLRRRVDALLVEAAYEADEVEGEPGSMPHLIARSSTAAVSAAR